MSESRRRTIKIIAPVLAFIFVFFCLIPYGIPLKIPEQQVAAEDIAFENSKFLSVDGVSIHYRLWEPQQHRGNVLLVHGLGGSTFSWRHNVLPLVKEGYRVAAVDLPGFGLSGRGPGTADLEKWVEQLWILTGKIEKDSSWHLVGHSMGGGVVTVMSLERPEEVESLVLVCGAVYPPPFRFFMGLFKFPPVQRWLALVVNRGLLSPDRVEQLLESAYGRTPVPEEVQGYYLPLTIEGTESNMVELNTGTTLNMAAELEGRLDQVEPAVLCIWGEDDTWVPLELGERLAEDLPGAELVVIPGAAHCPMETHSMEFNSLLMNFLEKN